MRRYLLLGTGVAGVAAAEAIRSLDPSGEIVLVGDEPDGYYSRPGLAYVLTGELSEKQLFPYSEGDFRKLEVRRQLAQAVRLHPEAHQVELRTGARLAYDRLLVATGAAAARLRVPGADLQGVVKLDKLDDARWILKRARRARTAVVVGGGITALELVEGLVARGLEVHYLLRGERYWSGVLDEAESRIVEGRLQAEGVRLYRHSEVESIMGRGGAVSGVRLIDGRALPCELVAVAIGTRPRLELAEAAGLQVERGILVDEYLRTSAPDIFAAGDVAQVYDPISGRAVLDSLWGPARDQGWAAGLNMAGQVSRYLKPVAFNVTRLANLTTTLIGAIGSERAAQADRDLVAIARGDSETWRQLPDAIAAQSDFDVNHLRVLIGERRILGAVVMGDQTLSRPLQHLVVEGADITPVREAWLRPGAPLADLIADFWSLRNSSHAAQQP